MNPMVPTVVTLAIQLVLTMVPVVLVTPVPVTAPAVPVDPVVLVDHMVPTVPAVVVLLVPEAKLVAQATKQIYLLSKDRKATITPLWS